MGRGQDPGRGRRPPLARRPGRTLTRLEGRRQATLRLQPVEAAQARCWGGLVRPVQVAVVPEAACEEEEPPPPPHTHTEWPAGEPGPPRLGDPEPGWTSLTSRGKPLLP